MSGHVPQSYPTRQLPQQPSLEQLRKQAKDLLGQYRAGDPAAVAEVEKFERRPDPATFALNDSQRVLHYAVLRRDAAMVKLLMEAGADARKGIFPHRDATSALSIAEDREYSDIVAVIEEEERLRREEMSCPNATISPVQEQVNQAIAKGENAVAIRMLETDGSLIQACDREGGTPLHVAAQAANEEMVAWLLKRRAPVRKQDMNGLTALDRIALAANPRNEHAQQFPSIAKLLLEAGAEVTIRAAVALADAERVGELVGKNPEVLREIHWTRGGLLSLAVNHRQIEIVRLLLDLGADVDERVMLNELEEPTPSWGTPLWYAALAGQRHIVELLLDQGADPNANVYASGWPLRNAWGHKDDSVKRLLLARGAKPQPYMIAEAHDVDEAKRLLEADTSEELALGGGQFVAERVRWQKPYTAEVTPWPEQRVDGGTRRFSKRESKAERKPQCEPQSAPKGSCGSQQGKYTDTSGTHSVGWIYHLSYFPAGRTCFFIRA